MQQQQGSTSTSTSTTPSSLASASNMAAGAGVQSTNSSARGPTKLKEKPASLDPLQNDWRLFECHQWHLEPTVRLISWAGSEIVPYGVDYILQRLGFSHARTTIPKWMQRGCMDPLDKVLSIIVMKSIQLVQEDKKEEWQQQEKKRK